MENNFDLQAWAQEVIQQTGFAVTEKIYQAEYYNQELRNIIYAGSYNHKPAVLKIYYDRRLTDEPQALESFNQHNQSKLLLAPEVYDYQIVSPHQGWLIEQYLGEKEKFLSSPLDPSMRSKFIDLYQEYRQNFPIQPTRELTLVEKLQPGEYHLFRITRWLELANKKEVERKMNQQPTLLDDKFLRIYTQSVQVIQQNMPYDQMVWCHGHFKPKEIFQQSTDKYYLTDFAHNKMYPQSYELAFIVWADWFMSADWDMPDEDWLQAIWEWMDLLLPLAQKLEIKHASRVLKTALIERSVGMILGDLVGTSGDYQQKRLGLSKMYLVLEKLLSDL